MPQRDPLIRIVAMPADTNPHGDIFGGWLMSLMDLAAGTIAMDRSHGRSATVAMDGMTFHAPVAVGDEVSVYGELVQTGQTSMTIAIEAWRRNRAESDAIMVTSANFTFVAIDDHGRPRAIDE